MSSTSGGLLWGRREARKLGAFSEPEPLWKLDSTACVD
jgi:hypothetical protein